MMPALAPRQRVRRRRPPRLRSRRSDGLTCAAANAAKTFARLDPLRAQSDPAARGNGGLWHVDV